MADEADIRRLLAKMIVSGQTPEEVCKDRPELLPELRKRWRRVRATVEQLDELFPSSDSSQAVTDAPQSAMELPQIPGYTVQSVLGHGGMGVVYKAVHLKLNRAVALKMPIAGAFASPTDRQRLVREAQAVAALGHPNIVTVHDVGEFEGRPFFTMELIDGENLGVRLASTPQPAQEAAALVSILADAMHSAHQAGIVHRDLKPANVLLTANGTPKITDFGLARHFDGEALTLAGCQVGTPSYMAPEQAGGQPGANGTGVDIYSLGAILYELLTGRPPFRAETAIETQRQVVEEEPVPPSRLNAQVPRDLETICLKCLEKDPRRRYPTPGSLAEDLRRFQRGEPISARPAGPAVRLAKWIRRRPTQAMLIGVVALCAVALLVFTIRFSARRTAVLEAVERDLEDVVQRQRAWDWTGARTALERATARLGDAASPSLRERIGRQEGNLQLVARLEEIRETRWIVVDFQGGTAAIRAQADRDYTATMQAAGIGAPLDDRGAVAKRIGESPVASALVAALDDWTVCQTDGARMGWLLEVARRADTGADDWRDRARDGRAWNDVEALLELARTAPVASQPVQLLTALAERIRSGQADEVPFLTRVQEAHPDDYWANFALGNALLRRGQFERATRYHQASVALRPDSAAARNNLAIVLARTGQINAAMAHFRSILLADPQYFSAHMGLANCLLERDEFTGAVEHFGKALEILPGSFVAHSNLGVALTRAGRLKESREEFQAALRHNPDHAPAHCGLGNIARRIQQLPQAVEHFQEALRRDPKLVDALMGLGDTLREMGRVEEGLAPLRRSLELAPHDARTHFNLGVALLEAGQMADAIDALQTSVRIDPTNGHAHGALSEALIIVHRYREAAACAEKAIDLLPANHGLQPRLADFLDICQEKSQFELRWPAVLSGRETPSVPAECLEFADMGYHTKHFAVAAQMFEKAFDADPRLTGDVRSPYRRNAASVAALAGSGRGVDGASLSDDEKAYWRAKARQWLRAELASLEASIGDSQATREFALGILSPLQSDPDFAVIRDEDALSDLPPAEAQECRALWADVASLIQRLSNTP